MAKWTMTTTLLALFFGAFCPSSLALQISTASTSQGKSLDTSLELEESLLTSDIKVSSLVQTQNHPLLKLHLHFHKAGGTLMCRLAQSVGELPPLVGNCNWRGHDALRASGYPDKWPSCSERLAIYKEMNWTYAQMEREIHDSDMCEGIHYSVLLREPIELITSTINYERQQNGGHNSTVRVGHMQKLISDGNLTGVDAKPGLMPNFGWKFMDNMQTRLLSGAIDVPPGHVTSEHLAKAKRRLAKFHAVARLEDLADPAAQTRFFGRLGWDVTLETHHVNSRKHTDKLTEAQKTWLTELNKHDYALYRSAAPKA